MADAGLIKAAESNELDPAEAVITRVTHAGHQFYRTFKNVRSFANIGLRANKEQATRQAAAV
jgi:hypothetical protein